jgi:hypothetical protein
MCSCGFAPSSIRTCATNGQCSLARHVLLLNCNENTQNLQTIKNARPQSGAFFIVCNWERLAGVSTWHQRILDWNDIEFPPQGPLYVNRNLAHGARPCDVGFLHAVRFITFPKSLERVTIYASAEPFHLSPPAARSFSTVKSKKAHRRREAPMSRYGGGRIVAPRKLE